MVSKPLPQGPIIHPRVKSNWEIARDKLSHFFSQISSMQLRHIVLAILIATTTYFVCQSWPDFYGLGFTFFLPIIWGGVSYFYPLWGSLGAFLTISLVCFALSPILGMMAFVMTAYSSYRVWNKSPQDLLESLETTWLIGFSLPLTTIGLSLAIPILIGSKLKSVRGGAIAGMATFFLLMVWALLRGVATLGSTVIIDPNEIGIKWFLDIGMKQLLMPFEINHYLNETLSNSGKIFALTSDLWKVMVKTPAPIIGLSIWGGTGYIGAWLSKNKRGSWQFFVLPLLFFLLMQMLSAVFAGYDHFVNWVDLLFKVILTDQI